MSVRIFSLLILLAISLSSCRYLEIDTPGIIDRDRMFEDEQGYRDALMGIYSSLTSPDLYGKELSFGFIDEIAQLYYNDFQRNATTLTKTYDLRYRDPDVRKRIDAIWKRSYRTIAAINSLLEYTEGVSLPSIREIRGEALAMRAFIHFDILRLFAPNADRPSAEGIPYVTTYTIEPQPYLSVSMVYDAILEDLHDSRALLSTTTKDRNLYITPAAVEAILARVHLWHGDLQEAADYARRVIGRGYTLVREEQVKMLFMGYSARSETIWALHAPRLYLSVRESLYPSMRTAKMNMVRSNYRKLFHTNSFTSLSNDYRFQAYFTHTDWGRPVVAFTKLYDKNYEETQSFREGRVPAINMIRIPEMYYILAESLYPRSPQESLHALNTVVTARGLAPLPMESIDTQDKFREVLLNEIVKEYWGEGQIFFAYKRFSRSMQGLDDKVYPASDATYILPLPEDEKDSGL